MRKDTKVVAHKDTGLSTCIFYKHGYREGYYSTLPIGYPLSTRINHENATPSVLSFQHVRCNIHGQKILTEVWLWIEFRKIILIVWDGWEVLIV